VSIRDRLRRPSAPPYSRSQVSRTSHAQTVRRERIAFHEQCRLLVASGLEEESRLRDAGKRVMLRELRVLFGVSAMFVDNSGGCRWGRERFQEN
jgi:hypothetical protein